MKMTLYEKTKSFVIFWNHSFLCTWIFWWWYVEFR